MHQTTDAGRQCLADYRDRRRREAARGLGLDPDTLRPLPRPAALDAAAELAERVEADADALGPRERVEVLTALAALSSAESASRSAAALESIAASLARLASGAAA